MLRGWVIHYGSDAPGQGCVASPLNVEVDQHKGGPGTKFGSDPTKTLSCKPKKGDWMDASVHGPRSTSPAIINCSRHLLPPTSCAELRKVHFRFPEAFQTSTLIPLTARITIYVARPKKRTNKPRFSRSKSHWVKPSRRQWWCSTPPNTTRHNQKKPKP